MIHVRRPSGEPAVLTSRYARAEQRRLRTFFMEPKAKGAPRRYNFRDELWGKSAGPLRSVFRSKCAYCELTYEGASPADVEHWRPKAAVITGAGKRLPRGYYWLASEWTNLLPSCPRCNREEGHILPDGTMKKLGKANKFPLADEAGRATSPEMVAKEQPLLLDPCVDSPEEHLEFFETKDEKALLRAKGNSVRGQASIDIYGLNRPGLVRARQEYLGWIEIALSSLQNAVTELDRGNKTEAEEARWLEQLDQAFRKLRELRMANRKFCALARAMIDPQLAALGLPLESP